MNHTVCMYEALVLWGMNNGIHNMSSIHFGASQNYNQDVDVCSINSLSSIYYHTLAQSDSPRSETIEASDDTIHHSLPDLP